MDFLDVPTLLKASALFNLLAALAWLMLAQVFRIAPRAGRLMAAGHLVRMLTQGCGDCMAGWPELAQQAIPEFGLLACTVLLLLALRRMLRGRRQRLVAWVGGLGALAIAAGLASGSGLAPQVASTVSVTLLSMLATREIVRSIGDRLSPVITACTALPFAAMAALGLAHTAELLLTPGWDDHILSGALPTPERALLWFVVTAGITLSLIALMIWRLITRIQHLTFRDPLTGAMNRRAFEQALVDAQAQLARGRGFALAMIDIDHFKRVNDLHGHPAGDAALQHCVAVWQAGLREVDRLGRLGGEEFCVLLPLDLPGDLATAAAVAERLRSQLEAQPLRWKDIELPLSASFGVALPVVGDAQGEVCLARADGELYRAKAEGRNRVCVATHLLPAAAPMITPAQTLTLLALVILVAGVATLVWLALALIARIAPRASLAMACANAAAAASLTLHALRGVLPDGLTYWPGDVLAVASFALLGTAVSGITLRRLVWRPGAVVVAATALLLLALPYEGDLRWQARIVNLAGAGLTLAAGLTAWRALSGPSNGRRTPAPLALPLFLIAALMAARGLETFIHPGTTPDMRLPTGFNLAFLWTALVLTLLQNATLAFLVLMRLILRIERLLERDPLTDTLNRRAFDQALEHAHAWLARGRGYALVMIDMDRFKQLNDSLGHAAGDAALRQMVKELQPCVREVDRFGRLGGEEFCMLLPDTDLAGAALVAERMRMLVDMAPLRWLEQDWPLSASFGIAEAERGDASADAVLARADAALYRAKNQGRNVVQA